jgi:hypothetical protein
MSLATSGVLLPGLRDHEVSDLKHLVYEEGGPDGPGEDGVGHQLRHLHGHGGSRGSIFHTLLMNYYDRVVHQFST